MLYRRAFIYNGISSQDYDILVSGEATYSKPTPRMDRITIPGRSGDVVRWDGSYSNAVLTYHCQIPDGFDRKYDDFMAALLLTPGYHKLEDTYHLDVYRMAALDEQSEPDVGKLHRRGSFDMTFTCRPERFLRSGLDTVRFTADGVITNPTRYASHPLLYVEGVGDIWIGDQRITVLSGFDHIDIDCDTEDATSDGVNANAFITLLDNKFPEIPSGTTGITLGTGIRSVTITPRWWTL